MTGDLKIFVEAALGQADKAMADAAGEIRDAAMDTANEAAADIKSKGRANIAAAGFSLRWQNALRVNVYPNKVKSTHPTILVYHKVPYSGIFETGGTISGSPFLWLPLPDAPFGSGGRRIPPGKFRSTIGWPLYSIKRPGKTPLLGANIRQTDSRAKGISLSQLRRGRNPGGRGTVRLVPLYFGVPKVTIRDKFSITEIAEREADQLPETFARNFGKGQSA
jgi:hypothetical protein